MKRDSLQTKKSSLFLPNLSLRHRIPILICLLLISVISIFGLISYLSLKNLETKEGKLRLISLATQANDMVQESINEIISITQESIPEPIVRQYLEGKIPEKKDSILLLLQHLGSAGPSVCAELRDSTFAIIFMSGKSLDHRPSAIALPKNASGNEGRVGSIYRINDSIYYSIIIPIRSEERLLGYVVRYRRIRIDSILIQHFSELSEGAVVFMGNMDGSQWTDLVRPVDVDLNIDTANIGNTFEYTRNNKEYISTTQLIPHTPWILVLESPRQAFSQSSAEFLNWVIIIGLFLTGCAIVVAWLMSQHLTQPLNELTNAVEDISRGNFSPNVVVHGNDEVGKLERSFNAMSEQLSKAQQATEQQILEAKQLNGQLRQLSAHMEKVREEERLDIAREMHDELGQFLTGFKMEVYLLKKKLGDNVSAAISEKLQFLENTASDAIQFVRKLSSELRLGPLEDLGLVAALEWYCGEFTRRYQIPINFKSTITNVQAPALVKTGLFRIYQESLTNIARHARATKVDVHLNIINTHLSLVITDNGTGFTVTPQEKRKTLGLMGMKERAIMIGGELKITATKGTGTTIEITVPLNEDIQYS